MVIEEGNLKFQFKNGVKAVKFDEQVFYKKEFNKLPASKGVDILADSSECIQFIEIKNCMGHERENLWRTSANNSKIMSAPRELNVEGRESLDIEVAKKVESTISCIYGAWTKSGKSEHALELLDAWKGISDSKILKDYKKIVVTLFLEGDFGVNGGPKSRSKKMIMQNIQNSLHTKLSWLNCKVVVVDSNTYNNRYFEIVE